MGLAGDLIGGGMEMVLVEEGGGNWRCLGRGVEEKLGLGLGWGRGVMAAEETKTDADGERCEGDKVKKACELIEYL